MRTTIRRARGNRAEALVARWLEAHGWRILGRQIRVARHELDLVAVDPGPPRMLVAVEVRSATSPAFGPPEERVDARKIARVYRAASALRATGALPGGAALPSLPWRVDLVLVELDPALAAGVGGPVLRHLRDVRP